MRARAGGAAREGRFEDEGWRVRKDGTKFWANVVITALRTENGELVGYAKVTRDLTERRRLEEERLSLAKAAEAIRLRDEFLSLAAHELKTPLTVLQLQLDTLNDRMDDSGHRVAKKLQRAAQSGERLALLVESLLDVSRIATGRFALDIKEFDLVDSINRVVDGLRPSADRRAARCRSSLPRRSSAPGIAFASNRRSPTCSRTPSSTGRAPRSSCRRDATEMPSCWRSAITARDPGGRARPHLPALRAGRVDPQLRRPGPRPLFHPGDRRRARRLGDRHERERRRRAFSDHAAAAHHRRGRGR